jgi:hypothetical protein
MLEQEVVALVGSFRYLIILSAEQPEHLQSLSAQVELGQSMLLHLVLMEQIVFFRFQLF